VSREFAATGRWLRGRVPHRLATGRSSRDWREACLLERVGRGAASRRPPARAAAAGDDGTLTSQGSARRS